MNSNSENLMTARERSQRELTRPRESTVRRLFAVSMNRCAFPGCDSALVEDATRTILAEICHICAESPLGPRFNPDQSSADRHGFDNLLLLCALHHKIIDNPAFLDVYTVQYLRAMKAQHEAKARRTPGVLPTLTARAIRDLLAAAPRYEAGAVHLDFRRAVFRVGGAGGLLGGGGGAGGILTIVGSTRIPEGAEALLSGEDGLAPGGGGGGAGSVQFVGRPLAADDVKAGFRISSVFPANAAYENGLLYVLGGGWGYCPVREFPSNLTVTVVGIAELSGVAPGTLLRLDVSARHPDGVDRVAVAVDIGVQEHLGLAPRATFMTHLRFAADIAGLWELRVSSAGLTLSTYPLELRHTPEQ